jgi:hypothetical protein
MSIDYPDLVHRPLLSSDQRARSLLVVDAPGRRPVLTLPGRGSHSSLSRDRALRRPSPLLSGPGGDAARPVCGRARVLWTRR